VLYVTERCVFRLAAGGLELIEIAPGVDLERDVLQQMAFRPAVSPELRTMDAVLFDEAPIGLRERMLTVPLAERLRLDAGARTLYIDFAGLVVDSAADIAEIEAGVMRLLSPLDQRVDVVVNYDHFSIRPDLVDRYGAMVQRLTERHYRHVTRYAAGGFLKATLDRTSCDVPPTALL
jgi:propionate CoA-transferase